MPGKAGKSFGPGLLFQGPKRVIRAAMPGRVDDSSESTGFELDASVCRCKRSELRKCVDCGRGEEV